MTAADCARGADAFACDDSGKAFDNTSHFAVAADAAQGRGLIRPDAGMHEAGIAQEVIDVCTTQLRAHGGTRATTVGVRIGALASVDPDALRFSFDCLKLDTPLESATLRIEWRSRFGCACEQAPLDPGAPAATCPVCGAAESLADAYALDVRFLEFDTDTNP